MDKYDAHAFLERLAGQRETRHCDDTRFFSVSPGCLSFIVNVYSKLNSTETWNRRGSGAERRKLSAGVSCHETIASSPICIRTSCYLSMIYTRQLNQAYDNLRLSHVLEAFTWKCACTCFHMQFRVTAVHNSQAWDIQDIIMNEHCRQLYLETNTEMIHKTYYEKRFD